MLVTEHFVFIHLPKTGGAFIKAACDGLSVVKTGDHETKVPSGYEHLPVFAVVRNPWDWYVSWHHFQKRLPEQDGIWQAFSEDGRSGFEATVRRACGATDESAWPLPPLRAWLLPHLRRRGCDFYSLWWWWSFGRREDVEVGRFESLRADFLAFLDRHQIPGERLRQAVAEMPAQNATAHAPYRDYYSPELRDLVGQKARDLIGRYEYSF